MKLTKEAERASLKRGLAFSMRAEEVKTLETRVSERMLDASTMKEED